MRWVSILYSNKWICIIWAAPHLQLIFKLEYQSIPPSLPPSLLSFLSSSFHQPIPADDFQLDVHDPRFAALYESHHYAPDPANPHYKWGHPIMVVL